MFSNRFCTSNVKSKLAQLTSRCRFGARALARMMMAKTFYGITRPQSLIYKCIFCDNFTVFVVIFYLNIYCPILPLPCPILPRVSGSNPVQKNLENQILCWKYCRYQNDHKEPIVELFIGYWFTKEGTSNGQWKNVIALWKKVSDLTPSSPTININQSAMSQKKMSPIINAMTKRRRLVFSDSSDDE